MGVPAKLPTPVMPGIRLAGGLTRTQREHGFRYPVDYPQQRAGRTLRQELAPLPIAYGGDRYTDPSREFSLRESGFSANAPHPSRCIFGRLGVIGGGLAFDPRLSCSIVS